jgi:hypothetical protein
MLPPWDGAFGFREAEPWEEESGSNSEDNPGSESDDPDQAGPSTRGVKRGRESSVEKKEEKKEESEEGGPPLKWLKGLEVEEGEIDWRQESGPESGEATPEEEPYLDPEADKVD